MQADDKTTSDELAAILREKSAHVCARTAVKSTKFHTYVCAYVLLFTYIRTYVNFTVFVPHVASQYVRSALTFLLLVPYMNCLTAPCVLCLFLLIVLPYGGKLW